MEGFFFMADMLGFGSMIRNSTNEQRARRVGRWLTLVDSAAKAEGIEQKQLISDTVFAATSNDLAGLERLIRFAQRLLNEGVPRSLPIRGAICHGEHFWGELTHGKAVVDAHELESVQNWIGVTCQPELPFVDGLWSFGSLICYPAPMKSGFMRNHPVVDWNVPGGRELANMLAGEGLTCEGEKWTWALGQKLNNTVQFGVYKEFAKRTGVDPREFYWVTGLELAQNLLTLTDPVTRQASSG